MMRVPLAYGDIFDKVTILWLKVERLPSARGVDNSRHELELLTAMLDDTFPVWRDNESLKELADKLHRVNGRLWELEDQVRSCLAAGNDGPEFVGFAKQIFARNEQRAAVKRRINDLLDSGIYEEKFYAASAATSLGIPLDPQAEE